jgi:hypothetical protein
MADLHSIAARGKLALVIAAWRFPLHCHPERRALCAAKDLGEPRESLAFCASQ